LAEQTNSTVALLLIELQALEVELHHPGVRCSRTRLEQLLHLDFHEVGRSGKPYNRETVVEYLASLEVHPIVASDAFALVRLGPQAALLTYRSAHVEQGNVLVNHTLRSSVWLSSSAGWQLRYHQGTPAAQLW
jgi:hypothetical protein